MSEWQSIETAPRDGTKVDIWVSNSEEAVANGWGAGYRISDAWYERDAWWTVGNGRLNRMPPDNITHWMAVPAPPQR